MHTFDLNDATLVGNDTGGGLCQFALGVEPDLVGRVVVERGQDGTWYCTDCLCIAQPLIYAVPANGIAD